MNREQIVENIHSRHIILMPNGKEKELDLNNQEKVIEILNNLEDEELKLYIKAEELNIHSNKEPPSIKAMRQQELFDYEPASDLGNFRLYPKGQFVFDMLKDWVDEIAKNKLNAMQIDSPIIYDWNDKEIREQASSFHERHYVVKVPNDENKEFILRFAGDFGLFKIMKQAIFSYKMLPLRIYEFSKSFRYEKSGELSGLKRLRAFHMPDIHCFCKGVEEGWEEYQYLYRSYDDLANNSGIKYAVVFRIVEEFYEQHRERIIELLKYSNRPAFIEILSDMKHYWAVKHEFQAIDSVSGNVQLSSVQLDVKDAGIYGINYVNREGNKEGCVIVHSSIGSIERWLYSILEDAFKREKPQLPLWLSPIQVRLIPISKAHIDYCKQLQINGVRVDIDDSDDSLGKKIAKSQKDWIPYVCIIGDKEIKSGELRVNLRNNEKKEMSIKELEDEIKIKCENMPYRPIPVPKELSKRPIFFG